MLSVDALVSSLRNNDNDEIEVRYGSDPSATIIDVEHDSRRIGPNAMFAAIPGSAHDGHRFVGAAVHAGATAALVERWVDHDLTQIRVNDVRRLVGPAASIVHREPSRALNVFGVTGTNGKTTTAALLADILAAGGQRAEMIGTIGGTHTTPEATDLQRRLRGLVDTQFDAVALEVSSHGLEQHRVGGTHFAVAAFTNLTPEHLDFHPDMDSYFAAKARLFDGRASIEIINVDDPWGRKLAAMRPSARRVSPERLEVVSRDLSSTTFLWRGHQATVPLPGAMNVANAVIALEAATSLGLPEADACRGLALAHAVPGRMERVAGSGTNGNPTVIVDFSHTPDSIERALDSIRSVHPGGELWIVFGCGGDRDRDKRPLMAEAAERGADHVIVTSDNPRTEAPDEIIAQAAAGLSAPAAAQMIVDRRAAIHAAIDAAASTDVVLIAGKGHEATQTIGTTAHPFLDVDVAAEALGETA